MIPLDTQLCRLWLIDTTHKEWELNRTGALHVVSVDGAAALAHVCRPGDELKFCFGGDQCIAAA